MHLYKESLHKQFRVWRDKRSRKSVFSRVFGESARIMALLSNIQEEGRVSARCDAIPILLISSRAKS